MSIDRQLALSRAFLLKDENSLDAATMAVAEQLSGKMKLTLGEAVSVLGNNQIAEVAGFLSESLNCQQLEQVCDTDTYDLEQAREWGVTEPQYCLAHEIALIAHMTEHKREGLD
ncbi:hypothetical protein AAE485_08825 [Acidithiobacillus ferriphilus]|jgi:hypothetical protein|uniref:hypothetical protein n=1 Tax=Acidithiobacillus ferriphilus TaxID=1689834 RepID=UPI00390C411A|nr:hypothetical protein [Acidithiobacillus ferriphilus]